MLLLGSCALLLLAHHSLWTHDGQWMSPECRQATVPQPRPCSLPGTGRRDAQMVVGLQPGRRLAARPAR